MTGAFHTKLKRRGFLKAPLKSKHSDTEINITGIEINNKHSFCTNNSNCNTHYAVDYLSHDTESIIF